MLLSSNIVGISGNTVFVKKIKSSLYRKYDAVIEVGNIIPLYLRINGCSPMFKHGYSGLTALHCVADLCRLRESKYSNGDTVIVKDYIKYRYCRDWLCNVLAKYRLTNFVILPRCIEKHDHAWVDKYNTEYQNAIGILFAGSTIGRLALILSDIDIVGEDVKIISYDYEENKIVEWESKITGRGLFKVDFGKALLWFDSYYIFPTPVKVKPGYSGSNVFLKKNL